MHKGVQVIYSEQYSERYKIIKITVLMQKGKVPVTVFLDVRKAFDTLNHDTQDIIKQTVVATYLWHL